MFHSRLDIDFNAVRVLVFIVAEIPPCVDVELTLLVLPISWRAVVFLPPKCKSAAALVALGAVITCTAFPPTWLTFTAEVLRPIATLFAALFRRHSDAGIGASIIVTSKCISSRLLPQLILAAALVAFGKVGCRHTLDACLLARTAQSLCPRAASFRHV